MQCFLIYEETKKIFQSETITCIRKSRQGIRFSIQFTGVFWSLSKYTKVEYGLIKAFDMHIEREKKNFFSGSPGEKFFLHTLVQKQKYYFFDLICVCFTYNAFHSLFPFMG